LNNIGTGNQVSPPLQVKKTNDLLNVYQGKNPKIVKKSPMPFHKKTSPTKKDNILSSPSSYQNPIKLMQQD
jgi:hypothetical protein